MGRRVVTNFDVTSSVRAECGNVPWLRKGGYWPVRYYGKIETLVVCDRSIVLVKIIYILKRFIFRTYLNHLVHYAYFLYCVIYFKVLCKGIPINFFILQFFFFSRKMVFSVRSALHSQCSGGVRVYSLVPPRY